MRHRRSQAAAPSAWPLPLRTLIRAAEIECPPGHAAALQELTSLALHKVPARGIFDPGTRDEHEMFAAIEAVARAHLRLASARTAWQRALDAAPIDVEQRDAIESAALHVQTVSDTAYFYAGLAFGLTFACLGRGA